jgi:uncharacterized delta-60 repeat protein
VCIQPDGKIVVGGVIVAVASGPNDYGVVRYNTDGTLDTTFGTGGVVTTQLADDRDVLASLVLQSDGKIVVGGSSAMSYASSAGFTVVRYNADGSLDNAFGTGGVVRIHSFSPTIAAYGLRALALQSDGKIVATGVILDNGESFGDIGLARFNTDGSLDASFGSGGLLATEFGTGEDSYAVAVQSNGKILVAGFEVVPGDGDTLIVRVNADGTLDNGFGTNGACDTNMMANNGEGLYGMVLQPDGNILVAGLAGNDGVVARVFGDPNHPPVANAGGPYSVPSGGGVQLDASATTDPDQSASSLTYQWDLNGNGIFGETGAAATRGDETGINPTFFAAGLTQGTTVTVSLLVTDGGGLTSTATATINVVGAQLLANAGGPYTVDKGGTVQLDASGTTDGNVPTSSLTFLWDLDGDGIYGETGPAATRGNEVGIHPTFSAAGYTAPATVTVSLQVSDPNGRVSTTTATIDVIDSPPVANAGGPYSVPAGGTVQLNASASSDPDDPSSSLTYQWDLKGNGIYGETGAAATRGDEVGVSPTFSAAGLDGPTTVAVSLRVLDPNGAVGTTTATINVLNVPPTAGVSGPSLTVPGQTLTYTLTALDPEAADQVAGFTFGIDWDNDGTVDQTVQGPSGITVTHTFTQPASIAIHVTATDKDGGQSDPAIQITNAVPALLETDPIDGTKTAVFVGGTPGGDTITFTPGKKPKTVDVTVNGVFQGTFSPTGHLIAYGEAGNDTIKDVARVSGGTRLSVAVPAIFYGGDGNDLLSTKASTANNILLGGDGNDTLQGGSGRDLLVGGPGADSLDGGAGDDLLIAGSTSYETDFTALGAVMAEWGRTDASHYTRINHLTGGLAGGKNGAYLLTLANVSDDTDKDVLTGRGGLNWFFAHATGAGVADLITDLGTLQLVMNL